MKARRILTAIFISFFSMLAISGIAFFLLTDPNIKIADWQELDMQKFTCVHQTARIKDSNGNVIAERMYYKNRIYTPIEEIPRKTLDAFIGIEDKRFYRHNGVDYIRMLGALKNNLFSGSLKEGASTITQQLIKNTHLTQEKTFRRKFQEIRLAKQLEKKCSKEEILETYLNIVYFGNNVYGIGQAAQTYFHKNVSELDLEESALLAGIINNPSKFNPITRMDNAKTRRNIVLQRMLSQEKIDATTYQSATQKTMQVYPQETDRYATYLENVIAEAATALDCLPEEVFAKNPTIITHANYGIFNNISHVMSGIVQENDANMRLILLENSTASVLVDLGNVYGTPTLRRQPGSTIKPFVCYAPALEKKLVYPLSVLRDERTDFGGYAPKNFGDTYYGNVTVADSLKLSLNIPAVKLSDMCGLSYAKTIGTKFGIPFSPQDQGLSVALGGLHTGTTLNELTDAYATLARAGKYLPGKYIKEIQIDDKTVYSHIYTPKTAVTDDTAFLLTDMLTECAQSGTAKKLHNFANVAAKTGTVERGKTNSDAYCIAYTPRYTVAAWYGNPTENIKIYGGQEPAALVAKVLQILDDTSKFQVPDSVVKLAVDRKKLNDEHVVYLASPLLPKRYTQDAYFSKQNIPKQYSYPDTFVPLPFQYESSDFENFEIIDSFFD